MRDTPRIEMIRPDGGRRLPVEVLGWVNGYFWVRPLVGFTLGGVRLPRGKAFVWTPDRLTSVTLRQMKRLLARRQKATAKPATKKKGRASVAAAGTTRRRRPKVRATAKRKPRPARRSDTKKTIRVQKPARAIYAAPSSPRASGDRSRPSVAGSSRRQKKKKKASPPPADDGSPQASPAAVDDVPTARICAWCTKPLTTVRGRFCGRKCRQTAFRLRRRQTIEVNHGKPLRFAYGDPPYPGHAKKLYRRKEVNHRKLIERLKGFDGWALSTSAAALRKLLPMCPPGARVCAWTKTHPPSSRTYGLHNVWEPVIVKPGRNVRPGVPDALTSGDARGGGDKLIGRKPIAFAAWLFRALGMAPGDTLEDLYPGTRVVSRAWRELGRPPPEAPKKRKRRRRSAPEIAGQKLPPHNGAEAPGDLAPPIETSAPAII